MTAVPQHPDEGGAADPGEPLVATGDLGSASRSCLAIIVVLLIILLLICVFLVGRVVMN